MTAFERYPSDDELDGYTEQLKAYIYQGDTPSPRGFYGLFVYAAAVALREVNDADVTQKYLLDDFQQMRFDRLEKKLDGALDEDAQNRFTSLRDNERYMVPFTDRADLSFTSPGVNRA